MDKDVAKRLVRAEGIAVAPYLSFTLGQWNREHKRLIARIEPELGYPVFVKPATLGSSIGVTRAKDRAELLQSVAHAQVYDEKVLVERAVDAREIEVAVLAAQDPSAPPEVSVPGEIVAAEAFYSFERKYLDSAGADLHVPAKLDAATAARAQQLARRAFLALECEGMARIDFLLDRTSGELYFGEANTIPGFTSISMYPKLWEASGLPYNALLDRLIRDALARALRRSALRRER
jgi:D-alanine-D-alanine ligase